MSKNRWLICGLSRKSVPYSTIFAGIQSVDPCFSFYKDVIILHCIHLVATVVFIYQIMKILRCRGGAVRSNVSGATRSPSRAPLVCLLKATTPITPATRAPGRRFLTSPVVVPTIPSTVTIHAEGRPWVKHRSCPASNTTDAQPASRHEERLRVPE
jgi:hypothetical protein